MQLKDEGSVLAVRQILQRFQDGYDARQVANLDSFMDLFTEDAGLEVIGTAAKKPGDDEWCRSRDCVRNLIGNDWQYWGDLRLDVGGANVQARGEVAWLATQGTVTMRLEPKQEMQEYLDYVRKKLSEAGEEDPEADLLEVLRGSAHTLFEVRKGETYVWPLRFTAVLAREGADWRFHQMQFSFPTTNFPDVRLTSGAESSRGQ